MRPFCEPLLRDVITVVAVAWLAMAPLALCSAETAGKWQIGEPIVTWYAGPGLSDAGGVVVEQMRAGGWNVVWCTEQELDVAQRYGLRGMLRDGLLSLATLDDPAQRAQLDALIDRVRQHPAMYSYYLTDEPSASTFTNWGRLVAYLRERDPAHFAYLNLFPTYASNEQLGTSGDTVTAYREHLRQYVEVVKPDLLSYDHYHFTANGDSGQYFLNLAMIRRAALDAQIPFLNIVQACSWDPGMRVPNQREMRFLVYTSLAYGAQGLSHFVYNAGSFILGGGMVDDAGKPTSLYYAAQRLNPEFVAIARELQPLRSLGAYHAGVVPWGGEALPADGVFALDPPLPAPGMLLGYFGKSSNPTHVVVVNLDYNHAAAVTLSGPGPLEVFDVKSGQWLPTAGARAGLQLPPGGGRLLRIAGR